VVSLRHNSNDVCSHLHPFVVELDYSNKNKVIPNVATDIQPFVYPLYRFGLVEGYMGHDVSSGHFHNVVGRSSKHDHRFIQYEGAVELSRLFVVFIISWINESSHHRWLTNASLLVLTSS
jgi:hypothetical protein